MNKILKVLQEIIIECVDTLDKYFRQITTIVIILLTLVTMLTINDNDRIVSVLLYILFVDLIFIVRSIKDKFDKTQNGFPDVKKRFTKKLDDDMIVVSKEDWPGAILYLYEIENFLGK